MELWKWLIVLVILVCIAAILGAVAQHRWYEWTRRFVAGVIGFFLGILLTFLVLLLVEIYNAETIQIVFDRCGFTALLCLALGILVTFVISTTYWRRKIYKERKKITKLLEK